MRLRAEMSGQPRKIGGLEGLVPSSAAYDFDFRMSLEDGSLEGRLGLLESGRRFAT